MGRPERFKKDPILASPEDLRNLGLDESDIAAQEEAISKLSGAEKSRLVAQWEVVGDVDPSKVKSSSPKVTSPGQPVLRTRELPCWISNDYYRTRDGSGNEKCFADSGTYEVNYVGMWGATSLRAGNNQGRVLYNPYNAKGNPFWWSVYRGPNDYNWYSFAESVQIKAVNIV